MKTVTTLKNKLHKNKKGFTLVELLIVVAIIAVLVAISIPIFMGNLEKAREATDIANMRAAKAEAASEYLSENITDGLDYYYDATTGKLSNAEGGAEKPEAYGKGTESDSGTKYDSYDSTKSYVGEVVVVNVGTDGSVTETWK